MMAAQEPVYDHVVYEDGTIEQVVDALGIRFNTVFPGYEEDGTPEMWHSERILEGDHLPIAMCLNRRGVFN